MTSCVHTHGALEYGVRMHGAMACCIRIHIACAFCVGSGMCPARVHSEHPERLVRPDTACASGCRFFFLMKPLGCAGDRQGIDGVCGVQVAGGAGAASGPNIGGGLLMAARECATNGFVTGVVAMVMCCCCGQVSTFRGGVGCCPGPKRQRRGAKSCERQQKRSERWPASL